MTTEYDYLEKSVNGRIVYRIFDKSDHSETLAICQRRDHALTIITGLNSDDVADDNVVEELTSDAIDELFEG